MITPTLSHYQELAGEFTLVPIFKEVTELGSPHELFGRIVGQRYPFLLESGRFHPVTGRYSFLGWDPFLILKSKGDRIWIEEDGKEESTRGEPLKILKRLLSDYHSPEFSDLPPFTGGAVGYFGYEIRHFFEKLPQTAKDDLKIPDMIFLFFKKLVAWDHLQNKTWLITNAEAGGEASYQDALQELAAMEELLRNSPSFVSEETGSEPFELRSNLSEQQFKGMVERVKEHIGAGDIFQANLSQRLSAAYTAHPYSLYLTLSSINPSPFASFFDFGDFSIVSSSPERLVRKSAQWIETRPIAGTRPRGRNPGENLEKRIELLLNEKERAEHLMLIDLERNDIGRVCDYGTVHLNEMMVLEEYSHVMHIVSNIQGKLSPGKDRFDILRALFPGGTITGVPKVRCMEIIDALEPHARGLYTGSIGYLGFNGDMDLNIVIRTFVLKEKRAYIQVGCGIVADSDPSREYEESLHKAEALVASLRQRRLVHAL